MYCVLHSRTKGKKDFSFSGYFLLGFSHAENVFALGATVDVKLIQQRTEMHVTSVLNNYLESMWHMNATEDTEGPMFLLPSVHYILLVGFLPVEIHVRGWGL